jgi:hypothetical protein
MHNPVWGNHPTLHRTGAPMQFFKYMRVGLLEKGEQPETSYTLKVRSGTNMIASTQRSMEGLIRIRGTGQSLIAQKS